jgi:hypothetical protein
MAIAAERGGAPVADPWPVEWSRKRRRRGRF